MGGGKGLSNSVTSGIQNDTSQLASIAGQQQNNSNQLFNLAFPGMATAQNFYQTLASGDPTAIARATAPATQQINQAQTGAREQIMNNAPSGGEKNLALEQSRVAQGQQTGQLGSQAYLNAFPSLAQMGAQGVGQSTQAAGTGISGYGAANQGQGQLGSLQVQQKGADMGLLGGLVGDATGLAGASGGLGSLLGKGGGSAQSVLSQAQSIGNPFQPTTQGAGWL